MLQGDTSAFDVLGMMSSTIDEAVLYHHFSASVGHISRGPSCRKRNCFQSPREHIESSGLWDTCFLRFSDLNKV